MFEELFFRVSMLFSDKEFTGFLLLVGNILNQISDTAIKVFADPVKMVNIQPVGHFIVNVIDCGRSDACLACKFRLTHTFFAKYSG